ncbi:MAG: MlaD family protein [Kiloniellales bacterium]
MYSQKANYVLIGLFVIGMLVAMVVSLAMITGRTTSSETYFTLLDNVADVKYGTQVRYEGFPVGQVEEITPVAEGAGMRFRVKISVIEGWQIPSDSSAYIGATSFLAAKTIEIASGQSGEPLPVGGEIRGAPTTDMFAIMAETAKLVGELTKTSIKPLADNLNSLIDTVEGDVPRISQELVTFSRRLNETLDPIQELLAAENIQAVERTIGNAEEASRTLADLGADLRQTLVTVDNMANNLDKIIEDNKGNIDQTLKDAQYTLRSVARSVDSIVYNLEGTARNMNEFSRLIRQNPGLLLDGTPRQEVSPASAGDKNSEIKG